MCNKFLLGIAQISLIYFINQQMSNCNMKKKDYNFN